MFATIGGQPIFVNWKVIFLFLLVWNATYWVETPVVMFKLKKDRVFLLKELRSLVTSGLERSEDRRHSRKLRIMRKEVDKWINEIKETNVTPTTQS
jgi:hypothetical protein